MSFFMDREKDQGDVVLTPANAPPGAITSTDRLRERRVPPGPSRTKKWPVADVGGPPAIDPGTWGFRIVGLVREPKELSWSEFLALPKVKVFADFHCVTRWSSLGNVREGISCRTLPGLAGGTAEGAKFALAHGYGNGFTTNLPLDDLPAEEALVATHHDGEAISKDHGGPARLIVRLLYAWKSAKWISGLELLSADRAGFRKSNAYHMRGDPWREERHSW